MAPIKYISLLLLLSIMSNWVAYAQPTNNNDFHITFYGDTINIAGTNVQSVAFTSPLTEEAITHFRTQMDAAGYDAVITTLMQYKEQHQPDDWLFYQLIRRVAQHFSPKNDNYQQYTLYKWYLLARTGYDAVLNVAGDQLLFYVQCNENIYDIPSHTRNGKQYVCLNYHDYGRIDFTKTRFTPINITFPQPQHGFSYQLTQMPQFSKADYSEKELKFNYKNEQYTFHVKLNNRVQNIFTNYPVADYKLYFTAPLSAGTYQSLIPQLRANTHLMSVREGVDYLMRFTRYAFLYKPDGEHFGHEKRMLPEQTLLSDASDCEDRAALFFYLVKEIYNLPMIVLAYPDHVSIAVRFNKPVGTPILYNGEKYSLCDPTPQKDDIPIGQLPRTYKEKPYEVAFAYQPQ